MEMVPQDSPDCIPQEKVPPDSDLSSNSKKPEDSSLSSTPQGHASTQIQAKKQTRQWAAWTRQEEESFFSALRQVGKNFEKITSRVQSKNKDQVRHYYYRLVRRMNKLLGPELSLDAKNSKDTNAAMLRWWSLLEKYSCKASKLHLKPRRFKIFVETLENQLLRDRKKSIKRQVPTGENDLSFHNNASPDHIRAVNHDNRAVKMVLVDGHNIQKVGSGKGSLLRRPVNITAARTNYKPETAALKISNHRRKTAAFKRWEKAAIAGVSLVADAAEHLERVTVDTDKDFDNFSALDGPQLAGDVGRSSSSPPHNMLKENSIHNPAKLKLQLFPLDECTRRVLEKDNHNPHLELTLSTKKKISSVLDHLNHKWRNSSSSLKELVLFPFWAQGENLMGYKKWTKNSPLCAGDVYSLIGSPPIFRLRYGWFSRDEIVFPPCQSLPCTKVGEKISSISMEVGQNAETMIPVDSCHNQLVSSKADINPVPSSTSDINPVPSSKADINPVPSVPCKSVDRCPPVSMANSHGCNDDARLLLAESHDNVDIFNERQVENMGMELSPGEWADSLTNISMGDLLSDAVPITDTERPGYSNPTVSNSILQMPFTCDSFDAAIAAHIYKHQNRTGEHVSHVATIWEAEDTCDGFGFQKAVPLSIKEKTASTSSKLGASRLATPESSPSSHENENKESPEVYNEIDVDGSCVNGSNPDNQLGESTKDICGLTDMYWPDSLGPLDLGIPSCRYSTDLILSDSLSGFSRLLTNSLDAFQVASEPSSLFPDFKIRSEV